MQLPRPGFSIDAANCSSVQTIQRGPAANGAGNSDPSSVSPGTWLYSAIPIYAYMQLFVCMCLFSHGNSVSISPAWSFTRYLEKKDTWSFLNPDRGACMRGVENKYWLASASSSYSIWLVFNTCVYKEFMATTGRRQLQSLHAYTHMYLLIHAMQVSYVNHAGLICVNLQKT